MPQHILKHLNIQDVPKIGTNVLYFIILVMQFMSISGTFIDIHHLRYNMVKFALKYNASVLYVIRFIVHSLTFEIEAVTNLVTAEGRTDVVILKTAAPLTLVLMGRGVYSTQIFFIYFFTKKLSPSPYP